MPSTLWAVAEWLCVDEWDYWGENIGTCSKKALSIHLTEEDAQARSDSYVGEKYTTVHQVHVIDGVIVLDKIGEV